MSRLDDDAFRRAYEEYYPEIVGYFLARGNDRESSRDLAQDTFLRVYDKRELFRGEASKRTWIYHIARTVLLNDKRKGRAVKRRAETVPLVDNDPALAAPLRPNTSPSASPEDLAQKAEQLRVLSRGIERLPPRPRQCARLVRAGLSYREIARALDIDVNTVKYHMKVARQRLEDLGPELLTLVRDGNPT